MSLEHFNLDRFNDGDLWRQSKALIAGIPGLHAASVSRPKGHPNGLWLTVGALSIVNDSPVKVQLGETVFRGSQHEALQLFQQTQDVMGKPFFDRGTTRDQDFRATTDTDRQVAAAQQFLPFLKRLSLAVPKIVTPVDPAPIRTLEHYFYGNACPTREHIQGLADINVHLAELANQDVAPYEAIRDQAASWEPQKHMASFSWM